MHASVLPSSSENSFIIYICPLQPLLLMGTKNYFSRAYGTEDYVSYNDGFSILLSHSNMP